MVLHHLHVEQRGARAVGQRHAVARAYEGVRARLEGPSDASGGENDGLGGDRPNLAGEHLHGDNAPALAVLHDKVGDEPLLVGTDAGLDDLLVHHVKDRLARDVGDKERPRVAGAAEGAGAEPPLVVAVEDDAHVLELDDFLGRLDAHVLDGVLVSQVVGALHGVEHVGVDRVLGAPKRGVDAALGRVRVAAHRVHLAHHRHVGARPMRGDCGPHSREPRPHNQNVVVCHKSVLTCLGVLRWQQLTIPHAGIGSRVDSRLRGNDGHPAPPPSPLPLPLGGKGGWIPAFAGMTDALARAARSATGSETLTRP